MGLGSAGRGRRLAEGKFLFAGHLVEAPDTAIWDLPVPGPAFEDELHAFGWLEDLAAACEAPAAIRARRWTHAWIAAHGRGTGPGWRPDLAGRRVLAWVDHHETLLLRASPAQAAAFGRCVATHLRFLSRRARAAAPGLPRVQALTGLIVAGQATGTAEDAPAAAEALERELAVLADRSDAHPSRCPEAVLDIFWLAVRAADALHAADIAPGRAHLSALAHMAGMLRGLRLGDGGLARFHGGGRGATGRIDAALALSRVRPGAAPLRDDAAPGAGSTMGYARLSHGRATLVVDAAPPPYGATSGRAHASTLAFEMSSGRRPLVVNCGSGRTFGDAWRRAARATASHSTLAIDGVSSARLTPGDGAGPPRDAPLLDGPRDVRVERRHGADDSGITAAHDGYRATHGLTHVRRLDLSRDGRTLRGEDVLTTLDASDEARLDAVLAAQGEEGIAFRIRFHLHPDVEAAPDRRAGSVALRLPGGEAWVFSHDGAAEVMLEPSVYLEADRPAPVASLQIVLATRAADYATRVAWVLAKAPETPDTTRDLAPSVEALAGEGVMGGRDDHEG